MNLLTHKENINKTLIVYLKGDPSWCNNNNNNKVGTNFFIFSLLNRDNFKFFRMNEAFYFLSHLKPN